MTSLSDLYLYYCKRCSCRPNTAFVDYLKVDEKETRVFDFSKNFIGEKGIEAALETVRNNVKLEVLDLSDNWITRDSVLKLVKVAVRHPSLTSINLSRNPIHLSCSKNLLYLLNKNPNIVELSVEGSDIVPAMQERIAKELEKNRKRSAEEKELILRREKPQKLSHNHLDDELLPANFAKGEWKGETAGGCLNFTTWRQNPQFLLYPAEDGIAIVELRQVMGDGGTHKKNFIGMLVVQGNGVQRVLGMKKGVIVGESQYLDQERVKLQVRLERRVKGKDNPYVILPSTVTPHREGAFTITVRSEYNDNNDDIRFNVDQVNSAFDWFQASPIHSEWTPETAGGCRAYTGWRDNNQWYLSFNERAATSVRLVILLSKTEDEDDNDDRHIGFFVVPGLPGRQRRISIDPSEITGETQFVRRASVAMEIELDPRPDGYIIVPCTKTQGQTGPYTLTVYATSEVKIQSINKAAERKLYMINGEFNETTNGGYRGKNPASWIHAPSYHFRVQEPDTLLISAERRGAGFSVPKPLASAGNKDPDIAIGVMITKADDNFTLVKQSNFVHDGEVTISLEDLPPIPEGYLIIPSTYNAGDHCQFGIRIYASKPLMDDAIGPCKSVASRQRENEKQAHKVENLKRQAEPKVAKNLAVREADRKTLVMEDDDLSEDDREAKALRAEIIDSCIKTGRMYLDREFPAGACSLWMDPEEPPMPTPLVFAWKRPSEFMDEPVLFGENPILPNIATGGIQDSWLLGAIAMLLSQPEKLQDLFVAAYPEYGFYQIRFFLFGRWKTVTIDDLLPVEFRETLVFARTENPNELWLPLLEKAYAKLRGNYESLVTGNERQGVMDVTGGNADVTELASAKHIAINQRETHFADVWDMLVKYNDKRWLVGCGNYDKAKVVDGNYGAGILYNKVYPIIDVRQVQHLKLLKLRNPWGILKWQGKWSDASDLWTPEMRGILDYNFEDDGTFWMSFTDFTFFFNRLTLCRLPGEKSFQTLRWYNSWDGTGGGTLNHGTWRGLTQYAVHLIEPKGPTNLYVCLSQPMCPNVQEYNDIGFYIIETADTTQKLGRISQREVVHSSDFVKEREVSMQITIMPGKGYIFIPTTAVPRQSGDYLVTLSCSTGVQCNAIKEDYEVSVEGKWNRNTAGGRPGVHGTWRMNTQYLLYPSTQAVVNITLRQPYQEIDGDSTPLPIGLMVLNGKEMRRCLKYEPKDIIGMCKPQPLSQVSVQVAVEGVRERMGLPYVVIPYTERPGQESAFTLGVSCNKKMQLKTGDPDYDWCQNRMMGEWSISSGTAGGCLDFPSWRENQQFHLQFSEPTANCFIVLTKDQGSNDSGNEIGFVMVKCSEVEKGLRRKLLVKEEDIIISSMGSGDHVTGECEVPLNGSNGYTIIPYTRYPDWEGVFTLNVFTSCSSTLLTPKRSHEWVINTLPGEWVPGSTAGGARHVSTSTWYNNPFYRLQFDHKTTCMITLTQHPRVIGPDAFKKPSNTKAQQAMEQKKQRAQRRVPISEEDSNLEIGLDICEDNEDLTSVASASYTKTSEAVIMLPDLASPKSSYFIIPHTKETEQDAKFTVTIYSDLPVTATPFPKAKRVGA